MTNGYSKQAAALCCCLFFISQHAQPTSRVGSGNRIVNEEMGFRATVPDGVISKSTTVDGDLVLHFGLHGVQSVVGLPGFVGIAPFIVLSEIPNSYPELKHAEREQVEAWIAKSVSEWSEIPTGSCAKAYLTEKNGSFTGIVFWGKGRGIVLAGAQLTLNSRLMEKFLSSLEIEGACTW